MRETGEILKKILGGRGLKTEEDISEFLSDRPQKTYDPFLLLNMKAGVDLLLSEINSGKRICIYGDYDADGVTSICVLAHALSMLTDNYTYYIPSRFDEGYGLNKDAVRRLKEDGIDLIVTVDCGSVSYEEVEYAKDLGMQVIVTDHHRIDDIKADCILINPKQAECSYPFKELSGCGVAFKMVQAIVRSTGLPRSVINDVLDVVAVGTVGDIVSLTDENRTIVKYGLDRINSGRRKALKKLTSAISLSNITSENIAFGIAPHINAAGRMASAYEALELFMTDDDMKIGKQVKRLIELNGKRKKMQDNAYNQCMDMISGDELFVVLEPSGIHEGIAGIVAGKIKENVNRPVIIVTPAGDGLLKGTGRSIEKVDIYSVLKKHEQLFIRFGGHKSACGFLMEEQNLTTLKSALENDMKRLIEEDRDLFAGNICWEMELSPEEVNADLARKLSLLEPFGQDNPKPLFRIDDVILEQLRFMGETEAHARFTAVSKHGSKVDCVLFRKAQEKKELITSGNTVDLIGSIGLQNWRGRESVQFVIEEIM